MLRTPAALLLGILGSATAHAGVCTGWSVMPSPDPSKKSDNVLTAVAGRAANDVWAVGQYIPDVNLNVTLTLVAHYDGTAWTQIVSPNVGTQANALHGVAPVPGGDAWAVGYYIDDRSFTSRSMIQFWNGTAWQVVAHPADPGVSAALFSVVARSASDIWAVGEYQLPVDDFHPLTEHYDGTSWTVVPAPSSGTGGFLYGVTLAGAHGAVAVGEHSGSAAPDRALVLNWTGSAWAAMPGPRDGADTTRLYGVAADAAGMVHAAGAAENRVNGQSGLAEIGTPGGGLTIQPTVHVGPSDDRFYGIGTAPDGTSWAVGAYFEPKSTRNFTLAERAEPGGAWTVLPSPSPSHSGDSQLAGAAVVQNDVWAVGEYDGTLGARSLILHACR